MPRTAIAIVLAGFGLAAVGSTSATAMQVVRSRNASPAI